MPSQATIEVRALNRSDPLEFQVTVSDSSSTTRHHVSLSTTECRRIGAGSEPARCVEAAFRFLLDREPKESILRRFNLTLIGRYFPDFEAQLPAYLAAAAAVSKR